MSFGDQMVRSPAFRRSNKSWMFLRRLLTTSPRTMFSPRLNVMQIVNKHMQKLYPLELADGAWDNVGLLLEPTVQRPREEGVTPKVLLTIDLTTAVTDEALEDASGVEAIVTYRTCLWN
jgi:Duf34/NIF3 (NGG1p interacting factor 3)